MPAVEILHFSDVLCVWAYVSQVRIEQLQRDFGDSIAIEFHFSQVFGSTRQRVAEQWADRGGLPGYGTHVREVVADFDHVEVHPEIWNSNTPASCVPAHLFLQAVKLIAAEQGDPDQTLGQAAWAVRRAFFQDLVDISRREELLRIAESQHLPAHEIETLLDNGAAHASLAEDVELAHAHAIRVSPTMMFNEGRQRLTGNVGYRVIEANVRELLEGPSGQHSWC